MAASTTETATISTYLVHYTGLTAAPTAADFSKATQVCPIKSYPDMGGDPETIEVTDLTDHKQRNIKGVQSSDLLEFTANYIKKNFDACKTIEKLGEAEWFGLVFGEDENGDMDGHDGVIAWQGGLSAYITSGDVNSVREMKIVISTVTAPDFVAES